MKTPNSVMDKIDKGIIEAFTQVKKKLVVTHEK